VDAASAVGAATVSVGAGALVGSTVDVVVCAVVSTGWVEVALVTSPGDGALAVSTVVVWAVASAGWVELEVCAVASALDVVVSTGWVVDELAASVGVDEPTASVVEEVSGGGAAAAVSVAGGGALAVSAVLVAAETGSLTAALVWVVVVAVVVVPASAAEVVVTSAVVVAAVVSRISLISLLPLVVAVTKPVPCAKPTETGAIPWFVVGFKT
jgi:hypothetical protein